MSDEIPMKQMIMSKNFHIKDSLGLTSTGSSSDLLSLSLWISPAKTSSVNWWSISVIISKTGTNIILTGRIFYSLQNNSEVVSWLVLLKIRLSIHIIKLLVPAIVKHLNLHVFQGCCPAENCKLENIIFKVLQISCLLFPPLRLVCFSSKGQASRPLAPNRWLARDKRHLPHQFLSGFIGRSEPFQHLWVH